MIGEAVQEKPEGVSQKAVAAQTIGVEAILELFDAVLALSAIIVKAEDLRSATLAVGDQKTQVGSDRRMLGLIANAPLA